MTYYFKVGNLPLFFLDVLLWAGPRVQPPPGPPLNPDLVNPCLDASQPYHAMPWCNASLGVEDRITDALQRMTVDEKVDNLGTGNARVPSLGLPWYGWYVLFTFPPPFVEWGKKSTLCT